MSNPCGKNCEACPERAELLACRVECPGCGQVCDRVGCPIAACCREKGHETCATCNMRSWCPTRKDASGMARRRIERQAAEQESVNRIYEQAGKILRWLTPLFWILILLEAVNLVGDLFEGGTKGMIPALVCTGLTFLLNMAQTFCLWRLASIGPRFRKAALFQGLLTLFVTGVMLLEVFTAEHMALNLMLSLAAACIRLPAIYHLCEALAEMTAEADGELAGAWEKMWKWLIGVQFAPVAALVVTMISSLLGLLALLVSMGAAIYFGIRQYILLWRTISLYKLYLE